ncbi:hypothetical protein [Luteimonas cellulosilyticus]|nr:hypothetical protein [Luteimonas cellulosilyticus]
MSKVLGLPVAVWLACVAWPLAASDLHVALVKGVAGSVSIVQANATRTAEAGTQLRVSDRIVTAPGATASIVFRDGTMLTVGGGADVHVRDYVFEPKAGRYAFSLYMGQGSAIYESGKIGRLAPESV